MTQAKPTPAGWRELKLDGFMRHIGPLLKSTKPEDRRVYGLQMGERHKNGLGHIHGGVITSFLDQVIALEAWEAADRRPTVTVQMDTRFLSAAHIGDLLEARAQVRHATRSMMFVDADLCCGTTSIACASAVMKIVKSTG